MAKYIVGFREDGDCGYRGQFHGTDFVEISDDEYGDLYFELQRNGYSLIRVEESPKEIIDRVRAERSERLERELKEAAEKRRRKVEGHDVGYSPTEEEVNSAMNYIAGLPAETKWVVLAQHHPEAAHNGTLPIQTCPTC